MHIELVYIQGAKEAWVQEVVAQFEKKISHIIPFKVVALKSKSHGREQKEIKLEKEKEALIHYLSGSAYVVLFDERGKEFKSSEAFSKFLVKSVESGKQRVVFVIGGAYGFHTDVKSLAQAQVSLSRLTMSHHIAFSMAAEQIYRGLAIWKNLPYHND